MIPRWIERGPHCAPLRMHVCHICLTSLVFIFHLLRHIHVCFFSLPLPCMFLLPTRTFDPEEADFFYMPIYSSCFIFPIHCWADGPWWHAPSGRTVSNESWNGPFIYVPHHRNITHVSPSPHTHTPTLIPTGPRVMHVTNMMIEARDWVKSHFPYWDRRGGRDHIWFMSHDEGG